MIVSPFHQTIKLFAIAIILTATKFGSPTLIAQDELVEGKLASPSIESRLKLAGENRSELTNAIQSIPKAQLDGLEFLILNMPRHDLKNLSAEFLLTNCRLAYEARENANWTISDELFFQRRFALCEY